MIKFGDVSATPHILNKQPFTMAISGTLLQLNCDVTGGPTPRVYWKLNNDDIEDSPHIQVGTCIVHVYAKHVKGGGSIYIFKGVGKGGGGLGGLSILSTNTKGYPSQTQTPLLKLVYAPDLRKHNYRRDLLHGWSHAVADPGLLALARS